MVKNIRVVLQRQSVENVFKSVLSAGYHIKIIRKGKGALLATLCGKVNMKSLRVLNMEASCCSFVMQISFKVPHAFLVVE